MIALDLSTRSFSAVLSGAKSTVDASFVCTFVDEAVTPNGISAPTVANSQVGTTNGVTAVTLVSAPASGVGYRRRVKSLNLFNADNAAITITLQIVDTAGSVTTKFQQITLQTLEMLNYEEGFGFETLDVNGAQKSQVGQTSSATSTADSKAVLGLSGSSQASSMAALSPASVSSNASLGTLGSSQASSIVSLGNPASVSSNASLGSLGSSQASSLLTRWSVTISKTSSSFSF